MEAQPWLFLVAISLSACAKPTPQKQIVDDATAALGGRDRILAVKTLVLEGEGRNGNVGQDMTPGRRWTPRSETQGGPQASGYFRAQISAGPIPDGR